MIGEEVIAVYGDAGDGEELFEVQKLVRCGECKWFNEEYGSCHAYHWDLNQGLEYPEVDADDFCSYGGGLEERVSMWKGASK